MYEPRSKRSYDDVWTYDAALDRRVTLNLAAHARRLIVPVLALVAAVGLLAYARHLAGIDRDAASLLQEYGATIAQVQREVLPDWPRTVGEALGPADLTVHIERVQDAERRPPLPRRTFDPWTNWSALLAGVEGLRPGWRNVSRHLGELRQIGDAAGGLVADVESFQSIATGMVVATDELLDGLTEAEAPPRVLRIVGRQLLLIERLKSSGQRVLRGGDQVLAAVDRFGRDAVLLGEINNALLQGNPRLRIERLGNEDARALLEQIGRDFRDSTAIVERIIQGVSVAESHRLALAKLTRRLATMSATLDELERHHRSMSGSRPPFSLMVGAMIALAFVALAGCAFRFIREGLEARRALRKRLEDARELHAAWIDRESYVDRQDRQVRLAVDEIARGLDRLAGGQLGSQLRDTGRLIETVALSYDGVRESFVREIDALEGLTNGIGEIGDAVQSAAVVLLAGVERNGEEIAQSAELTSDFVDTANRVAAVEARFGQVTRQSAEAVAAASEAVRGAVGGFDEAVGAMRETSGHVRQLAEGTRQLGELAALVEDLADHCKMLSLNVAIQASMASEARRALESFANDAHRVSEQARKVRRRLEAVSGLIREAAEEASDAVKRGMWAGTSAADRAREAQAPLATLDQVATELAGLQGSLHEVLDGQRESSVEIERRIERIRKTVTELQSTARANVTDTARLGERGEALVERLKWFVRQDQAPAPLVVFANGFGSNPADRPGDEGDGDAGAVPAPDLSNLPDRPDLTDPLVAFNPYDRADKNR